jgi:uncharacterized protein YcbX
MLGAVRELWRFPVKSLQGERVEQIDLEPGGMAGDRCWGLVSDDGHLLSAKRVPELLWAAARTDADGTVVITLPDGTELAADDPAAATSLSSWLGRPVRLVPAAGSGDLAYQMTLNPPVDDAELFDIPTAEDRLHDLADLHVLTTASLAALAAQRPDVDWDVRRFRPGVLVDAGAEPSFVEDAWVGQDIDLGDGGARIHVDQRAVRCSMPLRAQPDGIERDVEVFRGLCDANQYHLGLYCRVTGFGPVSVGDALRTVPS